MAVVINDFEVEPGAGESRGEKSGDGSSKPPDEQEFAKLAEHWRQKERERSRRSWAH